MGTSALTKREQLRRVNPGPRVRLAARLYASGAVSSKREAARAVGLHPAYLSVLDSAGNEVTHSIYSEVDAALADKTMSLSAIIQKMSRTALKTVNNLMNSENDQVAMKAAADVLDRNPETSKTFKASISTFSLDGQDVKELAAVLVQAAKTKEKYLPVTQADFIRVEDPNASQAQGNGSQHHEEHHEALESPSNALEDEYPAEGSQGPQEE